MSDGDRTNSEGLARRAAKDDDAFAELFGRMRKRLEMWIATRMGPMLRSRLALEDVMQDTFVQAHRSLPDFDDRGPGSFQRWIFSVAENRVRDLHKYHSAQKRAPAREVSPPADESLDLWRTLPAEDTSPSGRAHRAELVGRLIGAIEKLPDDLREVLVRRVIAGQTFQEIAEAVDRRPAAVSGLFTRALRMLRDELRPAP
jgi:RNA polymerase sigma-70 factor (subfamily 1)